MERKIGKVIEIFVPTEYKNNRLVDVMDSKKIGFKVQLKDELIELIEEQNDFNASIMKNDLIMITKQNISGTDFVDIELYNGDIYE